MLIFMVVSSFLCSTYLLIAMTFERFYSIIRPHKAASFNTVMKAKIIIVCVLYCAFHILFPFCLLVATMVGFVSLINLHQTMC